MVKTVAASLLLLGFFNTCFGYEYDVKLLKKANNVKNGQVWEVVAKDIDGAMSLSNNIFENEIMNARIGFGYFTSFNNYSGHLKNVPEDIIAGNDGAGLGKMHIEAKYGNIDLEITNKTNEVLEIDLDKCSFTLDTYVGRLVRGEVRKIESASVTQPPLIVPPNGKAKAELYIPLGVNQDYPRLKLNKELIGPVVLNVNKNYISFAPSCIIDSSKLNWKKTDNK